MSVVVQYPFFRILFVSWSHSSFPPNFAERDIQRSRAGMKIQDREWDEKVKIR